MDRFTSKLATTPGRACPGVALNVAVLVALAMVVDGCNGQQTSSPGVGGSASSGGSSVAGGSLATIGGQTSMQSGASIQACKATPDPTPTLTPPSNFDASAVAKAAVIVGTCQPDDGVDRNATHIWNGGHSATRDYFMFSTQLSCLANSNCGCSGVVNCWGFEVTSGITSCSSSCQGSVLTACDDMFDMSAGYQVTMDCGKLGLVCNVPAACVPEEPIACDSNAYTPSCDANANPSYCDKGFVRRGPPCASLGLDCASGECVGRGAACTNHESGEPERVEFEGTACSGKTLTACVKGHSTTVDCSTMGPDFSCQTVGTSYFCGLANECVPATDYAGSKSNAVTCDGTQVVFCNAGRLEHIDCLSLGFTGCEIDHGNARYGCI